MGWRLRSCRPSAMVTYPRAWSPSSGTGLDRDSLAIPPGLTAPCRRAAGSVPGGPAGSVPGGPAAPRAVSSPPLPPAAEPAEVDRLVSASIAGGEPIYRLDNEAVRELRPDLVLTQDLCAVCAVPSGHVNDALELLGCRAEVLSMDPSSLGEVLACVLQVGSATGTERSARTLVEGLRTR